MAKDSRLELGRYIDHAKDPFVKKRTVDFSVSFQSPASEGQYPWNPSRFTQSDLLRKMMTRKLQLNPGLNFVGSSAEEYEVFANIGRFKRVDDYDFQNGRALTPQRPEDQPGFNDLWMSVYQLSPTIPGEKKVKNPMPRASNPDPKDLLTKAAESRVENEVKGNVSVAELLSKSKTPDEQEA